MNCIVTAGPTYEPLDDVRRLTNFSTGRLGTELANDLVERGHQITLLIGAQATHHGERNAQQIETFTTTVDLRERFRSLSAMTVDAIFHAAAVSDFTFGKIQSRSADGRLKEVQSKKIPTSDGTLLVELVPTPKIIAGLREWYPKTRIVGWKFEAAGGRAEAIRAAQTQITNCHTEACVANGPAYGEGFGLVTGAGAAHFTNRSMLFEALEKLVTRVR